MAKRGLIGLTRHTTVKQQFIRYATTTMGNPKSSSEPVLSTTNMNPAIKEVQYAVRGPIVARAVQIDNEILGGSKDYSFDKVIKCNIGDAHAMGQKPITFIREVVAGCMSPSIIPSLPAAVQAKCKSILGGCGGSSIGAYSASVGVQLIREHIAAYCEKRDGGVPCNPDDICLSTGASGGIVQVLKMLTYGEGKNRTGIMIPTPQYPLYSATISELQAVRCNYYLDEETNWSLKMDELAHAYQEAAKICAPRVLCIINPGNPTGNVLSRENIEAIIKFAYEKNLFLMADEVYQDNIYGEGCEFHSFKKVCYQLGEPYRSGLTYASFHSTSKGYMGECGLRGGYMELVNWDPEVRVEMTKLLSSRLCPPVTGQAAMDCVVSPPSESDKDSYTLWKNEKDQVLSNLKTKAKLTADGFNAIPGVSCQPVQGAMYSFPQIQMPQKFLDHCTETSQDPDSVYCMELLETKGICVVPGSGFGQRPGTHHFRMTILPPKQIMEQVMTRFADFHKDFTKKWA